MSDLRERALKAFAMASGLGILPDEEGDPWDEDLANGMDAAIALVRAEVLEEAARVAEGKSVEAAGNVYQTDKPGNFWDEDSVYGTGRRQAADAIRALKSKP